MPTPAELIARWKDSGGAELANSQLFLAELCALLEVPQPQPTVADESRNDYVFEKAVQFQEGDGSVSVGRIARAPNLSKLARPKPWYGRQATSLPRGHGL